jgi:hypothetical protein
MKEESGNSMGREMDGSRWHNTGRVKHKYWEGWRGRGRSAEQEHNKNKVVLQKPERQGKWSPIIQLVVARLVTAVAVQRIDILTGYETDEVKILINSKTDRPTERWQTDRLTNSLCYSWPTDAVSDWLADRLTEFTTK